MTLSLWAPYGDAIKLILTGSDCISTANMSSEQQNIFKEMLATGLKDDAGNKLKGRSLPGVQTKPYCVDEDKDEYETYYYIPDLFRFMLTVFEEWSLFAPPVNLDYLNSIGFMFSSAPGHKQWEESAEGKEHWELSCKKIEIEREIDELERTHHGNDPLKLEAQKRMRKSLDDELADVTNKLNSIDMSMVSLRPTASTSEPPSSYVTYHEAFVLLFLRLDTTPEEIAAWVLQGPENGGLAAYINANKLNPLPRFYYDNTIGEDYLSPLTSCWFYEEDVRNFVPIDRYITGKELIDRWLDRLGVTIDGFIHLKILDSRLVDYHPTFGRTQGTHPLDDSFPKLETGLFVLSDVESIEAEDFEDEQSNINEKKEILQTEPEVGSPEWRRQTALKAANAKHDKPGGSREKQKKIRDIWASGKYSTRDICAEQECAALEMSFSAARKALRNTPSIQK